MLVRSVVQHTSRETIKRRRLEHKRLFAFIDLTGLTDWLTISHHSKMSPEHLHLREGTSEAERKYEIQKMVSMKKKGERATVLSHA